MISFEKFLAVLDQLSGIQAGEFSDALFFHGSEVAGAISTADSISDDPWFGISLINDEVYTDLKYEYDEFEHFDKVVWKVGDGFLILVVPDLYIGTLFEMEKSKLPSKQIFLQAPEEFSLAMSRSIRDIVDEDLKTFLKGLLEFSCELHHRSNK